MGKKYLDTKKDSLEHSVLGVWKTAVEEGSARMDGRTTQYREHRKKLESARARRVSTKTQEGIENSPNPANKQHLCAKNVVHEEWGEGQTVSTMHDNPDEEGNIAWYDVMFEHGVEKGVSINELKVTKSEAHMHASYNSNKKKKKQEDVKSEAYEVGTDEYRKYMERITPGETIEEKKGDKEAYQKFFNSALKKFGVKSPAELEGDKKKEFYDYVDKNWKGDHEEAFEFGKEAKVASIMDTVRNMWQMGEEDKKTKKEDDDKEIKGDKTLTGKKSASVDVDPDIKEKHKKKVHASKAY